MLNLVAETRRKYAGPEITVELLEKCLDRIAFEIDRDPKCGVRYLPIYDRIEAELDAMRSREDRLVRIRQRVRR